MRWSATRQSGTKPATRKKWSALNVMPSPWISRVERDALAVDLEAERQHPVEAQVAPRQRSLVGRNGPGSPFAVALAIARVPKLLRLLRVPYYFGKLDRMLELWQTRRQTYELVPTAKGARGARGANGASGASGENGGGSAGDGNPCAKDGKKRAAATRDHYRSTFTNLVRWFKVLKLLVIVVLVAHCCPRSSSL